MVWDFAEGEPVRRCGWGSRRRTSRTPPTSFASARGGVSPRRVHRTSATQLPDHDATFDAVITDPPYYDNISYADLSDFFYVWLKRSVGLLFRGRVQRRAHAEASRGDRGPVPPRRRQGCRTAFYEEQMANAFAEAHRVLKPNAPLVCVYAHKTTLGWSTLVDALRRRGSRSPRRGHSTPRCLSARAGKEPRRWPPRSSSSPAAATTRRPAPTTRSSPSSTVSSRSASSGSPRRASPAPTSSSRRSAPRSAVHPPRERRAAERASSSRPRRSSRTCRRRVLGAVLAKVHGLGEGVGAIDPATRYYVLSRTVRLRRHRLRRGEQPRADRGRRAQGSLATAAHPLARS